MTTLLMLKGKSNVEERKREMKEDKGKACVGKEKKRRKKKRSKSTVIHRWILF